MKILFSILVVCCLAAVGHAFVITGCPEPLRVTGSLVGAPSNFIGNLLHYNRAPNIVNSGNPIGPYFLTDNSDCSWVPNGLFRCHLFLYNDSDHTQPIGDGLLQGTLNKDAVDPQYAYGCLSWTSQFHTLINIPFKTEAEHANFRNTSTTICFRRQVEISDGPTPYANLVVNNSGVVVLTIWGSNGYNPVTNDFDPNERFVGFDGRFILECPEEPPIIVGCPCEDPAGTWYYDPDCIQNGVPITVNGPGTCVSLTFVELPDNGGCVPQPDAPL